MNTIIYFFEVLQDFIEFNSFWIYYFYGESMFSLKLGFTLNCDMIYGISDGSAKIKLFLLQHFFVQDFSQHKPLFIG